MNEIVLSGVINQIEYSHTIGNDNYDKAILNVDENKIPLRFKDYTCPYDDGDIVNIKANIRSYSYRMDNGKNKVNIYCFTYFDKPEEMMGNKVFLDGRICKVDRVRKMRDGSSQLHFTLANNIISRNKTQKLNNYIPCILKNELIIDDLNVNDIVKIEGKLQSRDYIKIVNGVEEQHTAYEVVVERIEK